MAFFDKKEDVIDIELTPYGKHLLSKGQFSPVYYEFYDDDILYDGEWAGITEIQGQIQSRINSTPKLKTQYTFESAEQRMKEYKKNFVQDPKAEPIIEKRKNFSFSSLPLGNSSGDNAKGTSMSIRLLSGQLSSSSDTNSKGIPRGVKDFTLASPKYTAEIRKMGPNEAEVENPLMQQEIQIGSQRVEITKKEEYILLDLEEMGVDFRNDNFEIHLYEVVEEERTGTTIEKPLSFKKEISNVVDGILYEAGERKVEQEEITKEYSDYFFSILKDKEIPNDILCSHLSEEEIIKLNTVYGYSIVCDREEQLRGNSPELFISEEALAELEDCEDV